jgi:hypothetical protein
MEQNKVKVTDEEIVSVYNEKLTLHEAAVKLKLTTVTLWRRAKSLDLKWSDLKRKSPNSIDLYDILEGKHPEYQTFKLKGKLLAEGVKQNKCEICGITEWNSKALNMQLDHIDGDPHNHLLRNLRMVCPNCHSQTDTYCGKKR